MWAWFSLYNQGFDESDDSESEFDIFDDLPLARIGAVNPMMDFIDGKYADLKKVMMRMGRI